MDREDIINQYFSELDSETDKELSPIFYDELDEAIIGVTERMNQKPLVTYS